MKKFIPFLFLATGCEVITQNPYLSPFLPTIKFDQLKVNSVDFQKIDTEFVFSVDNPNPVGINIEDFSYALGFSNVEWMTGDNPDGLLLNPSVASQVSLPTEIVFADLYEMVQASRGLDALPFKLDGDFGIRLDESTIVMELDTADSEGSGDTIQLPYDVAGDFPALRRPTFTMEKLKITDYALNLLQGTAHLNLDLIIDVDNEHASNLMFQRFSYDVEMGGANLITGVVDNLEEIIHGVESQETSLNRKLHIPIQINAFDTVASVWSVLSAGGGLNLGFNALADVDTPFGLVELQMDENGNVDIELQ
jgi:LEA14-like dessication related protein